MGDAPKRMSLGFHHYAIVVSDLAEAVRWYETILDFTVERRFGFEKVGTSIAHVTNAEGVRIEIIARDGSATGSDVDRDPFEALLTQGAKHIGFLVEDIQATAAELQRRGATLVIEPNVVEPAGVWNCWIRDPSGTLIEFDQWIE